MKLAWHESLDGDLEAAWLALADVAGAGPFQRPEWHLARTTTWNPRDERYLALWADGSLLAVWPLAHRGARITAAGRLLADYLSPLVRPGRLEEALVAFAGALAEATPHLDFPRLEPEMRPLRWQSLLAAQGLSVRRLGQESCPVLDLSGGFAAVESRLGAGLRQRYRYAERRLGRMGALRVAYVTKEETAAALLQLVRWHQARFRARGTLGTFFGRRLAFHQEVVRTLGESGLVRLVGLTLEGRPLAYLYAFRGGQRFYYYSAGFDAAWAKYSPGLVLLKEAVRLAAEEGAREFDFLRGEEAYKRPWATSRRRLERVVAVRPGHGYYLSWADVQERGGRWLRGILGS